MAHMSNTRRIITGHNEDGRAIFQQDEVLKAAHPFKSDGSPPTGSMVGFTLINRTQGVPAQVQDSDVEYHGKCINLADPNDVICRVVEFPPSGSADGEDATLMHRTQSLDYGVVLKGTIQLQLDDGVERTVNEGDVVVQRATMHGWKNISAEPCRMLFVLVPSETYKVAKTGEELKPTDNTFLAGK